jgi:NAD(P)-dependent dehydrogenase (short-subunit alcohol dehydrogenase family)
LNGLVNSRVLPQFKEQNSGNIINIEEPQPKKGFNKVQLAASKFAVRGMTQSWQVYENIIFE